MELQTGESPDLKSSANLKSKCNSIMVDFTEIPIHRKPCSNSPKVIPGKFSDSLKLIHQKFLHS